MRPADGGAAVGVPVGVPAGDPDAVRQGARALVRAAGALGSAARRTTALGLSGSADWAGPGSSSFVARTATTSVGLDRLGEGFSAAGRALEEFAEVLAEAQHRARRAQADLLEAVQEHAHAMRVAAEAGRADLGGLTDAAADRATGAARSAQRSLEARADSVLRSARAHAQREAEQAREDVDAAARRAAWRLGRVVDGLRATTVKDLLEWLGGPDTAFGLLGLFSQGVGAKALYDARTALLAGDIAKLAALDPVGHQRVLQVAAQHGDSSMQALRAQLQWESRVLPRLLGQMSDASVPLSGLPPGRMAAALDILGKAGVVTSLVSNGYTVFGDDDASVPDKVAAGLNTVGLGMAATGSAGTMGLVGLSATTGWVPVVGQVVIAVTAAYLAVDWYLENKEIVHAFFDDVGDQVGDAVDWTGQELREYADEVRRELETARSTVVGVAAGARDRGEELLEDAGELAGARERGAELAAGARERGAELAAGARERGEELLEDAGELASDAREGATRLVSAVNPFD